jgi:hypothetical protein
MHYVMIIIQGGVTDRFYFTGPFATEFDAAEWGSRQDRDNPSWHVLELEKPDAVPRILPPTTQTIASGRVRYVIPPAPGKPGYYVLCFNRNGYHLIGPFGDAVQLEQLINYTDENDGPYKTPEWYPLLLHVPPGAPKVVPNTMPPLPAEEVQRRRAKQAEEDAFLETLYASWCRTSGSPGAGV